jgi:hypothetical protein
MEPIQKKSNSTLYVVISLIVVAVIVALVLSNKKEAMNDDVVTPGVENTTTDSNVGAIDPNKEGASVGSNAGKYADLVLKYKDRTLQFNEECAVVRNSYTFKQGTDVMLDNRDTTSVKIVVGSRTFNLKAQSYKVIDLGSTGIYRVDCNDRLNVVTVNVQK